jgi:hypothetical protein
VWYKVCPFAFFMTPNLVFVDESALCEADSSKYSALGV